MSEDQEAEKIRQKKLQEQQKDDENKKAEEKLKASLRVVLEPDAYDRMTNVGTVNKELFLLAAQNLLMLYKRAGRKITDAETQSLLQTIKEKTEKQTTITFHRK